MRPSARLAVALGVAFVAACSGSAGPAPCTSNDHCLETEYCGPSGRCTPLPAATTASVTVAGVAGHAASDVVAGPVRVSVTAVSNTGVKKVELEAGSAVLSAAADSAPPSWLFDVPAQPGTGDLVLRAVLTTLDDKTFPSAAWTLHYDNVAPAITLGDPAPSLGKPGTSVQIAAAASESLASIGGDVVLAGTTDVKKGSLSAISGSGTSWTLGFTFPADAVPGTYRFVVTAKDAAGNASTPVSKAIQVFGPFSLTSIAVAGSGTLGGLPAGKLGSAVQGTVKVPIAVPGLTTPLPAGAAVFALVDAAGHSRTLAGAVAVTTDATSTTLTLTDAITAADGDGRAGFQATITDAAGNVATGSAPLVIDKTPPALTGLAPSAAVADARTGSPAGTVLLTGTASEPIASAGFAVAGSGGATGGCTCNGAACDGTAAAPVVACAVPVPPVTAPTAVNVAVRMTDAIGNASADASNSASFQDVALPASTGFNPNAVTISLGGSASLTPTFSNGTATVTNNVDSTVLTATSGTPLVVAPSVTTTYTLLVTNAAGTTLSPAPTATVTVGPAAKSIAKTAGASGDNQSGVAGTQLAYPLSVTVTDAAASPTAGVTVGWAVGSGGGSISAASSVTNGSGVATIRATLGPSGGTNTYVATVSGLTGSPLTFTATAAKNIAIFSGNNQTGVQGTTLPGSLFVKVTSSGTAAVPGITVNWTFSGGGPGQAVSAASSTTDGNGLAQIIATLGSTGGANTFTATVAGLTGSPITFTATAAKNVAKTSGSGGDNQTGVVGTSLVLPLSVTVTDGLANPVAGIPVAWAVASGGGTVTAASSTSDAQGVATMTVKLGATGGANGYTATVTGLTPSSLTFSAQAASVLAKTTGTSGDGQNGPLGQPLPVPLSVTVTDGTNPVAGIAVSWAAAAGGGSSNPVSSATNGAGVATTTATLGPTSGANQFTATVAGLTGSPVTFSELAFVPPSYVVQNAYLTEVPPGVGQTLGLKVYDASSNPVAGASVAWAAAAGGGSVAPASVTTSALGVASTTATTGAAAVNNQFTATVSGGSAPIVSTFQVAAVVIAVSPASTTVEEEGTPVVPFVGTLTNSSDGIAWTAGLGSFSATTTASGATTNYLPPPRGSVRAPTNATVTAAANGPTSSLSATSTIAVEPYHSWNDWLPPPDSPASYTIGSGAAAGTVTDNVTGLVWQQTAPAGSYPWDGSAAPASTSAQYSCAHLSLGSFASGWRLPTIAELLTIVDSTKASPTINTTAFPGATNGLFWSSSPYTGAAGNAWAVRFEYGFSYFTTTSTGGSVRCVH